MIDIKEAIEKAKAFAKEILGQSDMLVEEVRTDPDAFTITLSIPRRAGKVSNPFIARDPLFRQYAVDREFKEFRVMKSDGTVAKMSIRLVPEPQ